MKPVHGQRYDPADAITEATELVSPFGIVQLAWRGQDLMRVRLSSFEPKPRRPGVRRYLPPHEPGQLLISQLLKYFKSEPVEFKVEIFTRLGNELQRRVWRAIQEIPYGQVATYGGLAEKMELPTRMARQVGFACGHNPLPIVVPCHRVIASTGALTGYQAGLGWKKALLELEGIGVENDRVLRNFEK